MKSYYYAHESAYKKIKEKNHYGWGNVESLEELLSLEVHTFLESVTAKWMPETSGKRALDLGCGTGTTAFTLAKKGFDVTGFDISETAIEIANKLSLQLKLKIRFKVYDILSLEQLNEKFDFVYDSHCLHCIVFDEDRKKVLEGIKKSLQTNGLFVLDTMVLGENTNATGGIKSLRFDKDYILWHKTDSKYRGVIVEEDQTWCAQRRIYPPHIVIEEMKKAGFTILSESIDKQESDDPWMLRLVLGL